MPGATVIDVGTTLVDGVLKGDVEFESAVAVAGAITPVPGGVGPVTNVALLRNVVKAAERAGRSLRSAQASSWRPTSFCAISRRRIRRRIRCCSSSNSTAARTAFRIVSRETGRFLSTIVTAMQANRILEVGTGYGYSTLWMALAQPRVGRIWTIDPDAQRTDVARSYFQRAGEDDYIEVFNTPALELLENFPQRNLDIVFVAANEARVRARTSIS